MKSIISIYSVIIIALILFLTGGCTQNQEGFAIYLTKGDISPARMAALSHIEIAESPVIGTGDIVAYNGGTHEITLKEDAFNHISSLEVPVSGRSFVVCVDKKPIYWGAFWTPISSISFDGVTILKPLGSQPSNVIRLELGYPALSFYEGEDPRNNPEVMASLEQADKLIKPPETTPDMLPRSMKGYELYSWLDNGQWHYTLFTGTNRNKMLEEVTSTADIVSTDGIVRIQVVGADAIKALLSRIPQDEFVMWLSSMRETTAPSEIEIQLPPAEIVDEIKSYAGQCGLDFIVPSTSP